MFVADICVLFCKECDEREERKWGISLYLILFLSVRNMEVHGGESLRKLSDNPKDSIENISNFRPVTCHRIFFGDGGIEVWLYSFLTSALDGSG